MFQVGDHLRVRRRFGYDHHGIMVGTDEVIDFSGGSLFNMPAARVRSVSLEQFALGGQARVTESDRSYMMSWGTKTLSANEVVERARWLVDHPTAGKYQLVGSNCEHVANWCETDEFESFQVRRKFLACGVLIAIGIGLWPHLRDWFRWLPISVAILSPTSVVAYNVHAARWGKLIGEWPGSQTQPESN